MRKEPLTWAASLIMTLFSCSNNNNNSKDVLVKSGSESSLPSQGGKDIVGEWVQLYTVFDKNGDNQLSENERENPSPNKIGDYHLRFNSDGSCTYSEMEFKGTYEVKLDKGKRTVFIQGADPRKLRILSLNGSELVLMPTGAPGTFLVYKRQ